MALTSWEQFLEPWSGRESRAKTHPGQAREKGQQHRQTMQVAVISEGGGKVGIGNHMLMQTQGSQRLVIGGAVLPT